MTVFPLHLGVGADAEVMVVVVVVVGSVVVVVVVVEQALGASMQEQSVEITSRGCAWHFDHAEEVGLSDVVDFVTVVFVVVVLVVEDFVVVAGARLTAFVVHLTGNTALQNACAGAYGTRKGTNSP